jgi:hypothetical protein
MDKLSERLWIMRVSLPDLEDSELATLDEAIKQIERYEDAPVDECVACDFEGYERPTWHVIDDREAVPLTLRGRVRILLDTEGDNGPEPLPSDWLR